MRMNEFLERLEPEYQNEGNKSSQEEVDRRSYFAPITEVRVTVDKFEYPRKASEAKRNSFTLDLLIFLVKKEKYLGLQAFQDVVSRLC